MTILERGFSKIRSKSQRWQRDIFWNLGLGADFFRNARGARIIIYHGVCREDHTRFNNIFLELETFKAHLAFYKKHFNVVSLDDYYNQRFSNDKYNVCLTFDDGLANNYKYVLPLLEEYQLPATFFITAIRDAGYDILWNDFLGIISRYGPATLEYNNEQFKKNRWNKYVSGAGELLPEIIRSGGFDAKKAMMQRLGGLVDFRANKQEEDYWLQMTTAQIRQLSLSKYATIGSHSYYHNDLSRIPLADAATEMVQSKTVLENMIQKEVNALAFPYGAYTLEVAAAAKEANYKQLLAMDFFYPQDQTDPAMRERFTVNPFISVNNQMYANITGKY
jgi:peptidoglycan/xylan/chitin deacetylase (PgdA/CDA1 family)